MYRTAPEEPRPAFSLWLRPRAVMALAFGLGTLAATTYLGVVAVAAEQTSKPDAGEALAMLAVGAVGAIFWGLLALAATAMPRWAAVTMLIVACLGLDLPKIFVLALGAAEGIRPSLRSRSGELLALVADFLLAASYAPVIDAARRLRVGDSEDGPLDLSAAACAWLAAVSALGVSIAPGIGPRAINTLVLFFAAYGLLRVRALLRAEGDRARAGERFSAGTLRGALVAVAGGALILLIRLPASIAGPSPAVRGIYAQRGVFDHCTIEPVPGGRDGVSLWRPDCGTPGPLIGWDEKKQEVIDGDALFTRLPETRALAAPPRP
jgi:hypothetical protein